MSELSRTKGREFRLAAPRVFTFLAAVGYPAYVGSMLFRFGTRMDWKVFLLGAAALFPVSIFLAGGVSLLFPPVRLTAEGIHAQNAWGVASFVRWQDIAAVRTFDFLNLRWLRIFSNEDRAVTWLAVFQSPSAEFKQEIDRLAPADSPIRKYLD